MRVRWTADAADDLERICDYISESRPESARQVAQSVVERISELRAFPRIGRPGRVEGTREIAFPPLPYLAVYEILDAQDEVRVLRVLHGAQQWPAQQR
jgi:addiction module RelE/StbE family toxin